jgi:DNA repair protein RadA/Sms
MAKVKPPFFVRTAAHNMQNGKDNVIPVKNGILLPRKLSKEEKTAWKSEPTSKSKAPKPLKINEIDSTQETDGYY